MDRGGTRVARPCPRADQPLTMKRRTEPLVLDVTLDDGRDRLLEHDFDELGVVVEELFERRTIRGVSHPGVVRLRAQRAADAREKLLVA